VSVKPTKLIFKLFDDYVTSARNNLECVWSPLKARSAMEMGCGDRITTNKENG